MYLYRIEIVGIALEAQKVARIMYVVLIYWRSGLTAWELRKIIDDADELDKICGCKLHQSASSSLRSRVSGGNVGVYTSLNPIVWNLSDEEKRKRPINSLNIFTSTGFFLSLERLRDKLEIKSWRDIVLRVWTSESLEKNEISVVKQIFPLNCFKKYSTIGTNENREEEIRS